MGTHQARARESDPAIDKSSHTANKNILSVMEFIRRVNCELEHPFCPQIQFAIFGPTIKSPFFLFAKAKRLIYMMTPATTAGIF